MSDIVFLLLIFFMLTSSFVNQAGVKIDYPQSDSQTPSDGANTVTITTEGRYYWNTREVAKEQIEELIRVPLTDNNPDNNVVTLQVDRFVTYDESMVVISAVARYGGALVIATKQRNEGRRPTR
jgi:biopolymer transport protein ExbD